MLKPVLHIALIGVALVSAFFSIKQKSKLTEQQEALAAKKVENRQISAQADSIEKEYKDEQGRLKKAQDQEAALDQSVAVLRSQVAKAKRDLAAAQDELAEQGNKLKAPDEAMEGVKKLLATVGEDVTPENLADKLSQLQSESKEKAQKIEEIDALLEGASKKLEANESERTRLVERKSERAERVRQQAAEIPIASVNNEWGFVVIAAGTDHGFTPQSDLIVKRSGQVIARLKPSSVEARQTIAEIDYSSVQPGVALFPGDLVIFANSSTN